MNVRPITPREKVLLAVAFVALVALALVKLVALPILNDWQETDLALDQMQRLLLSTQKIVQRAEQLKSSGEVQAEPSSKTAQMADFLLELESSGQQLVEIQRFQPLQLPTQESQGSRTSTLLQVRIECLGTLQNLLTFFDRIESKHANTRIRQLYILPEGRQGTQLQCQIIVVRVLTG